MTAQARSAAASPRWHSGTNIPMRVIRKFARAVAEQFKPDKIILFGSHAYGTPHADSDVDVVVVMPCRNQLDQAVMISYAIDPPFPLDIIVRKPSEMQWRLEERESFSTKIATLCSRQPTSASTGCARAALAPRPQANPAR